MNYYIWSLCFVVVSASAYYLDKVDRTRYEGIEDLKIAYKTAYFISLIGIAVMLIILGLMFLDNFSEKKQTPNLSNPVKISST